MCQVTPFIALCCGRTYVNVLKLPSCPDAWPRSKCPPELCIQIGGYEATPQATSVCWRCKAHTSRKFGSDRDQMRPGIDSAKIVVGLEELGVHGRRKKIEDKGLCWFCGSKSGCDMCRAQKESLQAASDPLRLSRKRHHEITGGDYGSGINKRAMFQNAARNFQTPSPATLPDPQATTFTKQSVYPECESPEQSFLQSCKLSDPFTDNNNFHKKMFHYGVDIPNTTTHGNENGLITQAHHSTASSGEVYMLPYVYEKDKTMGSKGDISAALVNCSGSKDLNEALLNSNLESHNRSFNESDGNGHV